MTEDISSILENWPYEGEPQVRIIEGSDGRQLLQVRQPLGIEQYEMEGRPDGQTFGAGMSYLDYLENRLASSGTEEFFLDHDEFLLLQGESVLYYLRYILLYQIGDYSRTVRDTDHNLRVCDLVEHYAREETDKAELLQYKPYILRINSISRAMLLRGDHRYDEADRILRDAMETISGMADQGTIVFKIEKIRSLRHLKSVLSQAASDEEDLLQVLKMRLQQAVEMEDYEHAAELRDMIRQQSDM